MPVSAVGRALFWSFCDAPIPRGIVTGRSLRLVVFSLVGGFGVFPVYVNNLPEVFDTEVGERRCAVCKRCSQATALSVTGR